ncbi:MULTISPECIES: FAD-binding oxidoreductase [unclassified Sphingomonas]|uniref:NAD(P)/FAD-dependent oxidoreductase n=1 Tax=unclassified Sphingomonas TaxID=196159 RepID=UPI000925CB0A|nr:MULTISPECIES: FAD-binding oxidoreductase [unclassified Sphingomonas]MBN8847442.1 FAD-binding oxidoreductase [Sphingomonas sp.]OJV32635.1 MAG: hypothetical protein BGO24_02525 [Sphingomonas sp. 67-36]
MELTESRDLRGGQPCWSADGNERVSSDILPEGFVDVAVVGAGVMGAMLAERLSGAGKRVLLLDRRRPAHGSTAASTALVMWSADVPLSHLSARIGLEEAARRWRRVQAAVRQLDQKASSLDCGWVARPELYLAGTLLDEAGLRIEEEMRRAAQLPSDFFDGASVAERFGIAPCAALLSRGCYEVDPVKLTLALLARARRHGAAACFPADVTRLEPDREAIRVWTQDGASIRARDVMLATGYERATWFLPPQFTVGSSYAIATPPGYAPLWRENAMIWEASSPYLYARATSDGRVIAGGEDEDFADAHQRDALINAKSGTIRAKLEAMTGRPEIATDCAWAAAFGSSPDGLPAIGRAAGYDHLWLASGFGGNGITFAALATELLAGALDGKPDADSGCFDPYRFSAHPGGDRWRVRRQQL